MSRQELEVLASEVNAKLNWYENDGVVTVHIGNGDFLMTSVENTLTENIQIAYDFLIDYKWTLMNIPIKAREQLNNFAATKVVRNDPNWIQIVKSESDLDYIEDICKEFDLRIQNMVDYYHISKSNRQSDWEFVEKGISPKKPYVNH